MHAGRHAIDTLQQVAHRLATQSREVSIRDGRQFSPSLLSPSASSHTGLSQLARQDSSAFNLFNRGASKEGYLSERLLIEHLASGAPGSSAEGAPNERSQHGGVRGLAAAAAAAAAGVGFGSGSPSRDASLHAGSRGRDSPRFFGVVGGPVGSKEPSTGRGMPSRNQSFDALAGSRGRDSAKYFVGGHTGRSLSGAGLNAVTTPLVSTPADGPLESLAEVGEPIRLSVPITVPPPRTRTRQPSSSSSPPGTAAGAHSSPPASPLGPQPTTSPVAPASPASPASPTSPPSPPASPPSPKSKANAEGPATATTAVRSSSRRESTTRGGGYNLPQAAGGQAAGGQAAGGTGGAHIPSDSPHVIKAALSRLGKRSRRLFDRAAGPINSSSIYAFRRALFSIEPLEEPFLGAWMSKRVGYASMGTDALMRRQQLVQVLSETRFDALQRLVAFYVMFHAMGKEVQDWWPRASFGLLG